MIPTFREYFLNEIAEPSAVSDTEDIVHVLRGGDILIHPGGRQFKVVNIRKPGTRREDKEDYTKWTIYAIDLSTSQGARVRIPGTHLASYRYKSKPLKDITRTGFGYEKEAGPVQRKLTPGRQFIKKMFIPDFTRKDPVGELVGTYRDKWADKLLSPAEVEDLSRGSKFATY